MLADTFADLDVLAAKGDGTLWRKQFVWSYLGATVVGVTKLAIPTENVPDSRVRAALAAGVYVPAYLDETRVPPVVLAVKRAPADPVSAERVRTVAEFGRAA